VFPLTLVKFFSSQHIVQTTPGKDTFSYEAQTILHFIFLCDEIFFSILWEKKRNRMAFDTHCPFQNVSQVHLFFVSFFVCLFVYKIKIHRRKNNTLKTAERKKGIRVT